MTWVTRKEYLLDIPKGTLLLKLFGTKTKKCEPKLND